MSTRVHEIFDVDARLVGVRPAREVVDGVDRLSYRHSGPPLQAGRELPAALRGALIAGLIFEGEARSADEAQTLIDRGAVRLDPCQDTNAAGPLVGLVTPRMPMLVVERADGARFSAPLHEGDAGGARTGMFSPATIENLRWVSEVVAPSLDRVVKVHPRPLLPREMQREALQRGDECHNRNVAATAALVAEIAPTIDIQPEKAARALFSYFSLTSQFFIVISAAYAKAVADAFERAPDAVGVVTAMGMNGHEAGIRVNGLPGWYSSPAPLGPVVSLDGGDVSRSAPGQGDSPIIEMTGLGAFALSSAPALARLLGHTNAQARALVDEMRAVAAGDSRMLALPNQDYAPAPVGIDVRKVAATGVAPAITLGFLSREPGEGRVGAGIVRMPLEPFAEAALALATLRGDAR